MTDIRDQIAQVADSHLQPWLRGFISGIGDSEIRATREWVALQVWELSVDLAGALVSELGLSEERRVRMPGSWTWVSVGVLDEVGWVSEGERRWVTKWSGSRAEFM